MTAQHLAPTTSSTETQLSQPTKKIFSVTHFWAGLLLAWLLTLPAITPLLQPNTLPNSADGLLHLYRLVVLNHAIEQGAFFPRWLPDLAYGYGLPLFIFYAPLSYYISLILSLGLGIVNALNASLIVALLTAATGSYLFTGQRFGPKAGLVAVVSYVYAPILLLNTLFRGSMPAVWAMAIFPFVFWAFGRLIQHGKTESKNISIFLPLSALLLGAALLMHNISNVLFGPFLALYLGLELIISFTQNRTIFWRRIVLPVTLAGILGVGLAAFFLFPAMIEKSFVQVQRVIVSPDFDFRFHFTTLKNLLALPQPANTGLLNPQYTFALGLVQFALAVISLFALPRLRQPAQWAVTAFALMGALLAIFMMLPFSWGVWEQISILEFVQHPTRFLAPAAFILSILAGMAILAFPARFQFGITIAAIILIIIAAMPLLYPRYLPRFAAQPTLLDMMAYEHAGGAIGTTSFGEYLPNDVAQVPNGSPLEAMYQSGKTIERLDPSYLPAEAVVLSADYNFNQVTLEIDSPQPYQAIFHTFYFPGWTAKIDGLPAAVAPVTERGLIGTPMPAGRHQLTLWFQETPLRRVADVVSIISLVIILALLIIILKRKNVTVNFWPKGFTRRQFFVLAGVALLLLLTKVIYVDRFDTPLKHTFDGMNIAGIEVPQNINLGHQVNLLGYNLDDNTVAAGQPFDLTAYWQARQSLGVDYSSLAQLVDDASHLYAAQDNLHPGELPTTRWQPWGFVQDPHHVVVPPGTPPGDYFLVTGLYDPATWARLPILDNGDSGWADVVAVPVTVTKSTFPPAVEDLQIEWPQTFETTDLRLWGATPERDVILPNDFLRVALFWQAKTTPRTNYQVKLQLINENGEVVLTQTQRPSHNRYPTTRWAANEIVRDNHALWIPQDFPVGMYRLTMQLLDEAGEFLDDTVELGKIRR